jgi:ABC-type proline/glycine betaine transport system permease subunit
MFKEWLENMLYSFLWVLILVLVAATIGLIVSLWCLIYTVFKPLAIVILLIVIGVPLVALFITLRDNWSYVSRCFEEKMKKWSKKDV